VHEPGIDVPAFVYGPQAVEVGAPFRSGTQHTVPSAGPYRYGCLLAMTRQRGHGRWAVHVGSWRARTIATALLRAPIIERW